MNDELETTIYTARIKWLRTTATYDAKELDAAIAAAIRESFCVHPHRSFDFAKLYIEKITENSTIYRSEPGHTECLCCDKPDPAPGDVYKESEKAVREKADAMEAEELKRAERGIDQEAIKMWREK